MSSNGSSPPTSWPTSSGGPSGSGSPGVLVYVVVLISIAGLFSVGALLRFCIRKTAPIPGALPGTSAPGSAQVVVSLLTLETHRQVELLHEFTTSRFVTSAGPAPSGA